MSVVYKIYDISSSCFMLGITSLPCPPLANKMGKMIPLSKIISRNKITIPSHPLVAVFVGGTHGIGSYALLALASHHGAVDEGKGLRIYLVGRTEEKVEAIFREARKRAPRGDFRYVECRDASLLREVDGACKRILEMERKEEGGGKIDFLCQSQAIFCLTKGRQGELDLLC